MKNRFAGPCQVCGETVLVGAGTYVKGSAGSKGHNLHPRCATRARLASSGSSILSDAQRRSLTEPGS